MAYPSDLTAQQWDLGKDNGRSCKKESNKNGT